MNNKITESQRNFLITILGWHNDVRNTFTLNTNYLAWVTEALTTHYYNTDLQRRLNKVRISHIGQYKRSDVPGFISFNYDELSHCAINFAMACEGGFNGSFDDWYNNISPRWRDIANKGL